MIVLVFSDSHGRTADMCTASLRHSPDAVIHLGDHAGDLDDVRMLLPGISFWSVCGNCDLGAFGTADREEFTLDGVHILATHGHRYGVKYDLGPLINTGLVSGADLLLYGHTHKPGWDVIQNMTVLNPGSIGYGGTYAVLDIRNGQFSFSLERIG